jgi:hypothetical protein
MPSPKVHTIGLNTVAENWCDTPPQGALSDRDHVNPHASGSRTSHTAAALSMDKLFRLLDGQEMRQNRTRGRRGVVDRS